MPGPSQTRAKSQEMRKSWLLLFSLFLYARSFTQNTEVITVKTGTSISKSVPDSVLYNYPRFTAGTVYFRNGSSTGAQLNYNRFLDEMLFIATTGDTLAIADEETIKLILIDNDSFYYDKGYFLVAGNNGSLKLAIKQGFKILDKQKTAAFDMSSSVSSIRSVKSYTTEGKIYDLTVTEDLVLTRETHYFFGNKFNQFVPATKKNLLELYPKQRNDINNYIKEHEVRFHHREDLEKLLHFLATF